MSPYSQEQLAQLLPTTTLSELSKNIDAKTTVWQNRPIELHRHQHAHGPHSQNLPQDQHSDTQKQGPTQLSTRTSVAKASISITGLDDEGKERGKET